VITATAGNQGRPVTLHASGLSLLVNEIQAAAYVLPRTVIVNSTDCSEILLAGQ
jgi:hypothetical protein